MVLRKITVDTSVRYSPKIEQTKEKENKPKTKKADSLLFKQYKNFSQDNKKFLKNISAHKDSNILQKSICTSIKKIILLFIYE